ncbi:MAG TPA: hypothetical protein VFF24_11755 [Acidimicrobiia bacterium]|nr:hypothetical protein [Acidimicrobiia bacterium]
MLAIGLGLVLGPTGARAAEPLPPLVTTLERVTDGAADVLVAAPIDPNAGQAEPPPPTKSDNPRADITEASLEYAPGWIRMKVQVKNPTDPLKDPAWSDRSDAEWALDTNKDGQPEFTVEFASDKGELYGAVFDVAKPDDKSLCEADSAGFSPQDGYTLVIDPKCIGNPTSLGYSVAIFFDTNPKDEKAPMATDRVPDQGFKAVAAPGQPAEAAAPGPGTPPASAAPVAPKGAPSVTRGPAGTPTPGPAGQPAQAAPATPGASSAAPGDPSAAPGAPAKPLARTGSATETRALFGLGLMLFGAGLVVMTRPSKRMVPVRF